MTDSFATDLKFATVDVVPVAWVLLEWYFSIVRICGLILSSWKDMPGYCLVITSKRRFKRNLHIPVNISHFFKICRSLS